MNIKEYFMHFFQINCDDGINFVIMLTVDLPNKKIVLFPRAFTFLWLKSLSLGSH